MSPVKMDEPIDMKPTPYCSPGILVFPHLVAPGGHTQWGRQIEGEGYVKVGDSGQIGAYDITMDVH